MLHTITSGISYLR